MLAEHVLHIMVGLNDTYLANHLPQNKAAATAAVGTVGYIFWFIGLFSRRDWDRLDGDHRPRDRGTSSPASELRLRAIDAVRRASSALD